MHTKRTTLSLCMIAVAVIAALSSPVTSSAQGYTAPPVTISKEKVNLGGKIYYSHIVKEKQTLFSIAKAYEVTVDEITLANPKLKETSLKKNDIILIPINKEKAPAKDPAKEPVKEPAKETVKEPAKEPVKESAEEPAEESEEPVIEKSEKAEAVQAVSKKKQTIHKRKWYEDLDVIAQKYNVTVEAIMKANGLSGRKLTKGQKLIIPDGDFVAEEQVTTEPSIPADTTSVQLPEIAKEAEDEDSVHESIFIPKDKINMTLVLPIKAKSDTPSRNNLDFYGGVLTAIRNLGQSGINTELDVFDSSDPTTLIEAETIATSDMILGPVSTGDLRRLMGEIPEDKGIISPLDPRAEALAYVRTGFIQAPTPQYTQFKDLADWITEDRQESDKVLMISEKGAAESEASAKMKEAVDSSHLSYIPFSYNILEGRDVIDPLMGLMTAEGVNRVMIASESEAFVNDVVRNLNILVHRKMNIVLYAPAKIRTFETIEVENLHNTSLHVSLGYYIDYDDERVKKFLMEYRALYNTEPTQYAFQGYDLASYFISLCAKYGSRWEEKLDNEERNMLQSTFRFDKTECDGFINSGVRRIVYGKDWSITRIR